MIEVNNLYREFNVEKGWFKRKKEKKIAVNRISFSVNKGEIFGLLGQNGAGKTTTIKMLITLLAPTSGECKIQGLDVMRDERKIRECINFVFGGETGFYRRLSAEDNLKYFANLYLLEKKIINSRVTELLEIVGLSDDSHRLVETFSKGMIQRLQIARGLINNPSILFLDEPTIGLDAIGARTLRSVIKELKNQGKTIVLTTHYLHEAEELCDRIAIMNKGNILVSGTTESIKRIAKDKYQDKKITSLEDAYIELISGVEK